MEEKTGGHSAGAPQPTVTPQPPRDMREKRLQVISGLGVNANVHSWNNGELKPAIDKIAELGDVTWRVIIDKADWESQENPGSAQVYENGKMADLWNTVAYIESKPGQRVMVNVMGGVPQWMGGDTINEHREDDWVRMIASMVDYGRTVRGLDFTLLGPMNETDWDGFEGPQVDPRQYVRLLHKLIVRLDELGLSDIRLVGPDTASAASAVNAYLPELVGNPLVMSRIAYFAIHSYDGGAGGTADALLNLAKDTDFWVTEFSGPCPGCDSGSPSPTDWDSSALSASYAIDLLQEGASGLQQYDAWDGYYEHHESMGYWGLLAYDAGSGRYTPRKGYFVMKQLIKHTPRNAVRIEVLTDQATVQVVAFQDPASGRITFFGHNSSDQSVEVVLRVPQTPGIAPLSSYETDAGRDMQPGQQFVLTEGAVTYSAAPKSVFTLTGTPTKG